MKPIEEIGLLKMDFLGLRNLDVIEDALDIIERSTGERLDMATLPLDDVKTYEMMSRGDSIGVFQFESEGMREALQQGRPDRVRGPRRARRALPPGRHGPDPDLRPRQAQPGDRQLHRRPPERDHRATKGVILYQEQAMQIAKSLAGFSGPKADDLRKAIGKKNREAMAELKPEFFEGCRASGTSRGRHRDAVGGQREVRRLLVQQSHAACYALIAYRTAWLKANYPAEYMAALISSVMDTKDKVPFFVNQAEAMGIEILPPDVNESDHEFMVVEGNIRFGLDAVKGVGYAAVEAIKRGARRTARSRRCGTSASAWTRDGQQARDRGADQVRRVRLHRGTRRHARGAGLRAGRRPACPAGRPARPGVDLRPGGLRQRPARVRRAVLSADPAGRVGATELLAGEGVDRLSSPSIRSSACARRCA